MVRRFYTRRPHERDCSRHDPTDFVRCRFRAIGRSGSGTCENGRIMRTLDGHTNVVTAVAITPTVVGLSGFWRPNPACMGSESGRIVRTLKATER